MPEFRPSIWCANCPERAAVSAFPLVREPPGKGRSSAFPLGKGERRRSRLVDEGVSRTNRAQARGGPSRPFAAFSNIHRNSIGQ